MKGIDVSEHQSTINWDETRKNTKFAILRLGWIGNKNNHTLDKEFERNYNECKKYKVPVGVYVYCYSDSEESARSGAKWTLERLKNKNLELPVYIDMEDESLKRLGKNKLTNICIAFNSVIESNGFWAGVYANKDWYDNYLDLSEIKKKYTTWIAHYGIDINKYKNQFDMLQYSESERIKGVSGKCDVNNMYRDLIKDIENSSSNKAKEEKYNVYEVTATALNIRKGPGSKYESIGTFGKGNKIAVFEIQDGWGRTDKGWVSMKYTK